jgi:hypothetical protein
VNVVMQHRTNRRHEPGRRRDGDKPAISPQQLSPVRRRQPAVREQEDHQREQGNRRRPRGLQDHSRRSEGEPCVTQAIVENRVVTGSQTEHEQEHAGQQSPAHRVARLMPRHHHTDDDIDRDNRNVKHIAGSRPRVDDAIQHGGADPHHEHQRAQRGRDGR